MLNLYRTVSADTVHHNTRCICECKGPLTEYGYIRYNESPFENTFNCSCATLVLPRVDLNATESELYCLNCKCRYEYRSLINVFVAAVIIITVISVLICYATFLFCLVPLVNKAKPGGVSRKGRRSTDYDEQTEIMEAYETLDDYESLEGEHSKDESPRPGGFVQSSVQKLKDKQAHWKEHLKIQRSSPIYNTSTFSTFLRRNSDLK